MANKKVKRFLNILLLIVCIVVFNFSAYYLNYNFHQSNVLNCVIFGILLLVSLGFIIYGIKNFRVKENN